MNRKIKMAIFIVTVIITMGALHLTHYGNMCGMNKENTHCEWYHNHIGKESNKECNHGNRTYDNKTIESRKDTVK
jgi:hypothetical protein